MGSETNREMIEALFGGGTLSLDPQAEYELRADAYVMEMPQSGERIRGRDKMRAFQEAFPNPPQATLKRITGAGDTWIVEGFNDYGTEVAHVVAIMEFNEDGKIVRDTRYYASPFEAPEWRSRWVEKM